MTSYAQYMSIARGVYAYMCVRVCVSLILANVQRIISTMINEDESRSIDMTFILIGLRLDMLER
jgi:hypothetical protein